MESETTTATGATEPRNAPTQTLGSPQASFPTYPSVSGVTNAIAIALQTDQEPLLALADTATRVDHAAWNLVVGCVCDAVIDLLHEGRPAEALERAFEPARHMGFLRQIGMALTVVLVVLEEGAGPERAIQLASHAPEVPEIAILAALTGYQRWGLEPFTPRWRTLIENHIAPAA